jgi:hypothetical protein
MQISKEIGAMDQNNKILFLFHTSFALWILSIAVITHVWLWTLISQNEIGRRKGPGLNIKAL